MVGRSRDGSMRAFPVVETVHRNSILLVTEAPAQVLPQTQRRAQEVAQQAVACLDGAHNYRNTLRIVHVCCSKSCIAAHDGRHLWTWPHVIASRNNPNKSTVAYQQIMMIHMHYSTVAGFL